MPFSGPTAVEHLPFAQGAGMREIVPQALRLHAQPPRPALRVPVALGAFHAQGYGTHAPYLPQPGAYMPYASPPLAHPGVAAQSPSRHVATAGGRTSGAPARGTWAMPHRQPSVRSMRPQHQQQPRREPPAPGLDGAFIAASTPAEQQQHAAALSPAGAAKSCAGNLQLLTVFDSGPCGGEPAALWDAPGGASAPAPNAGSLRASSRLEAGQDAGAAGGDARLAPSDVLLDTRCWPAGDPVQNSLLLGRNVDSLDVALESILGDSSKCLL
jgi:hypothetical protein